MNQEYEFIYRGSDDLLTKDGKIPEMPVLILTSDICDWFNNGTRDGFAFFRSVLFLAFTYKYREEEHHSSGVRKIGIKEKVKILTILPK